MLSLVVVCLSAPAMGQERSVDRGNDGPADNGGGPEVGNSSPDDDGSPDWPGSGPSPTFPVFVPPIGPGEAPSDGAAGTAWAALPGAGTGAGWLPAERLRGPGVLVFDDAETRELIASGWSGAALQTGAGVPERLALLTRLAVQQGHAPHVGALQARYGTPQENGLADLQRRIDALAALSTPNAAELADLARLRAELAARAAAVKPGPVEGWELVDLDANGDGRVDADDLN